MVVMNRYYAEKLSAERLRRCYAVAPPRVRRYLDAEIAHVKDRLPDCGLVLELGCGYGRVIRSLLRPSIRMVGIDNSHTSLVMAGQYVAASPGACGFVQMNAAILGFHPGTFDVVLCIQNGISAFRVEPSDLLTEMLRVARPGGMLLFSSYSERFWPHRLEWFRLQSEAGLLGEIDWEATGNGVLVCKDGFRAVTFTSDDFRTLARRARVETCIAEVDDSSVFCEIRVP